MKTDRLKHNPKEKYYQNGEEELHFYLMKTTPTYPSTFHHYDWKQVLRGMKILIKIPISIFLDLTLINQ